MAAKNRPPENLKDFQSLVQIVEALRGPDGCPWDKEQTPLTLTPHAVEEVFELVEAVERHNRSAIIEELGDVLLQVVLHCEVARQSGDFNLTDVIEGINKKLVSRHPHVFADAKATNGEEALANWNRSKDEEKKQKGQDTNQFHGFDIPAHLPALQRAQKIGSRTKKFQFDWKSPQEVMEKVNEELKELVSSLQENKARQQSEMGDLLFSLAQLARHLEFDGEQALRNCNQRFERRFQIMMDLTRQQKQQFSDLSLTQKEALWQRAKVLEAESNPQTNSAKS